MKLVTWNGAMKFREKIRQVLPLRADIFVIPECEAPEKWGDNMEKSIHQFFWEGDNKNKGLGVFSMNKDYHLELHPFYNPEYKLIVPINVTGKENFILFAIWSQDMPKKKYSYIGQIHLVLQYYRDLLETDCILAGDWNSHPIFDNIKRVGTHTEVVNFLSEYSISSAYHHHFKMPQGEEAHPTLFFRKEKASPFHIDYVFSSECYLDRVELMEVGGYDEWIKYSDHMPIVLTIR